MGSDLLFASSEYRQKLFLNFLNITPKKDAYPIVVIQVIIKKE